MVTDNIFLQQWRNTKEKDYKECFTHEYCWYCCFCPGNNFNDTQEYLNGGENNCYIAKVRYNTVMRIQAGEDILQGKTIKERIDEFELSDVVLQREYK